MRIWAVNGYKFHPEKEQCVKRNDRKQSCITQDELAKNSLQAGFKCSGKVIVNKLNTNPNPKLKKVLKKQRELWCSPLYLLSIMALKFHAIF